MVTYGEEGDAVAKEVEQAVREEKEEEESFSTMDYVNSLIINFTLGGEVEKKTGEVKLKASLSTVLAAYLVVVAATLATVLVYRDARATDVATVSVGARDPDRNCFGTPGVGGTTGELIIPCWPLQALTTAPDPVNAPWRSNNATRVFSEAQPAIVAVNGEAPFEPYLWQSFSDALRVSTADLVPPGDGMFFASTENAFFIEVSDPDADQPSTDELQLLVAEDLAAVTSVVSVGNVNTVTYARRLASTRRRSFSVCSGAATPTSSLVNLGSCSSDALENNYTFSNGVTVSDEDIVCLSADPYTANFFFGPNTFSDFVCVEQEKTATGDAATQAFTAAVGALGLLSLALNMVLCRRSL